MSVKQLHSLLLEYDYVMFDSVPLRPANDSLDFCTHSDLIYRKIIFVVPYPQGVVADAVILWTY